MEKYYITSNKYSTRERETKTNGKVYDVIFRVVTLDGHEKQKWLRGFKTKTLAKNGYLAFVQEYCEFVKNAPKKAKNPDKDILLVGDLFRAYIASLGNQNKASVIYDKQSIFQMYVFPKFEKTPIEKLTKSELLLWQDEIWSIKNPKTGEYYSWNYLARIRTAFSAFLSWVELRYEHKNYLKSIPRPKKRQQKTEMKFWTKEQFEQFIAVVDDPTYHALFTFMFYTGRRKGELFALYKKDVHANKIDIYKSLNRRHVGKGAWEISSTKADKTVTIPVCKIVQSEIASYKPCEGGNFYFGGERPLASSSVDRAFQKYTEIAKLPRIRIHDLRHSFVSMLISLGANLFVIGDLISDTVEQVTRTYGHLIEEDKLKILDRI